MTEPNGRNKSSQLIGQGPLTTGLIVFFYAYRCTRAGCGQIEWLQSVQLCHVGHWRLCIHDDYSRYNAFGPWLFDIATQYYVGWGCWFVCLSAGQEKNYLPDFRETWWKGVTWAKIEPIRVLSRSESHIIFHFCR